MSDRYRRRDDDQDLAYGRDYSDSRAYNDQPGAHGNPDRGIIGDTFKKFKSKYDQHQQGQRPPQDFGYGSNPSSSTVGSQQYGAGSGYAGGPYNPQSQAQQYSQSAYPGGPPPQKPQQKPAVTDKILGGLLGSVTSIGQDIGKIVGGSHSQRPPQGQAHYGDQSGLQTNLQAQVPSRPTKNRYDSTFAGPKPENDVKWYVDGCSYMWAVSQALENARQTIWILDWWLSPELYLRRPPARNEEWRIDKVLQRAANRGVKVNIIVYKEVTQALTLSSSHTKHALENLSPNIGVFRHPDHLPDAQTTHSSLISGLQGLKLDFAGLSKMGADSLKGLYGLTDGVILYWAHHEKLCLVDGSVAFMGGLDLCYGRWDTNTHPIADAHPSDLNKIVFPGQDFNNARVSDFSEVNHPFQNKLDRTKSSRMGWSDISISLRGPCVGDLIHHFVDRWNFIYDEKYNVRSDKRYQRLPDYPHHHKDEGPGMATGPPQAGAPPIESLPQGGGYTQPPWQGSLPQASKPQQPTYGRPTQGQQTYPPPPPGQPPSSTQPIYSQQSSSYPYNQASGQYSSTSQSFPPPPPGPPTSQSQGQYDTGYNQQSSYQSANIPPTQYGSHQEQYQTRTNYGHVPQPPASAFVSAPPGYDSRPNTSSGLPEAQATSQQHAPYAAPHAYEQQGQPGSSGPAELGSSQYRRYDDQSSSRGFDDEQGYGSASRGERGFGDESYGYDEGGDRGYGRKPGISPSRFDRYKDEAKKLGFDVGRYTDKLEDRLDDKLAHHSSGRLGRPHSAGGGMSCQLVRSCTKWSNGTNTEHSIQNAYIDLIQNSKHFIYIENQFFITATGDKQKPVKNMIGKALVERIVRAARERTPFKIIVNIPSVPAFAGDLQDDASLGTRAIMEFQYSSICRGGHSIMEEVAKAGVNPMDYIRFYNLRNYDRINVTPAMQQAQQQAGISYDDARKQYESQLGSGYGGYGEIAAPNAMPGQPGQSGFVPQQGAHQGYSAPPQSYGMQQSYGASQGQYGSTRGPEYGEPGTPYGRQVGQQQSYGQQGQYQFPPPPQQPQQGGYGSQQMPQGSYQYQQYAQAAPTVQADDWDSVATCYMLGGQDIRNVPWSGPPEAELDAFVSEELYIHSKVMIVDDQTVVCGSANLNDRSMLGTHDSEIALIINDPAPIQTTMAGRPWQASRFATSLRRQLFRKHLGLLRPQDMQRPDDNFLPVGVPNVYDWGSPEDHIVSDPLSDAFQSLWNSRARQNTVAFRKAFRAVPDDEVNSWNEYKEFYEYYFAPSDAQAGAKDPKKKQAPRVEYGHVVRSDFPGGVRELKELLSTIKGTLVEMPLCFLQNEDIAKEGISFNQLTAEVYT
ncbi:hypothetical protein LTR05_004503 [Lithohypha guttulata]|uniref:phospholipase D n=1 Tax=Lithohypha guttulata TaxID=1690604 RepID=A0AAN7SYM5_9EURO|nr:hypothetical protein LTR05_004503 [Lithohypha guttulata]